MASFRARRPVAERAVDRLRDGIGDRQSDGERRTWTPDVDCRIVGCVDVEPADRSRPVRNDVLWEVAIRRLERCVRPGDWVCMLGGARIAVCLGNGGHRLSPTALGDRLARAMGDHLAVGSSGHDLRVSIGIGAGPSDAGLEELTAAALGAMRSGHGRAGSNGHTNHSAPSVAVAHVPSHRMGTVSVPARPASAEPVTNGTAMIPRGRSHRLVRRVMLPLPDQLPRERIDDMGVGSPDTSASTLRILVVGSEEPTDGMPRFTLEAVASVASRVGGRAIVCPSSQPDQVLADLYVDQPQVAVVVLEPESARTGNGEVRPWEQSARLVRALRDAGVPVIALGMGASAAAVATCVEQGAIGVLDAARLPHELASLAELRANGHNGNGQNGNGEASSEIGRGLPSPFSALVNLTRSERRVLQQMMEGLAAAEIAESLVVSIPTVRSHIRSILRKLNVNSQLAAVAIANGTLTERAASL